MNTQVDTQLLSLIEASKILEEAQLKNSSEPYPIWLKTKNAKEYINQQITTALGE